MGTDKLKYRQSPRHEVVLSGPRVTGRVEVVYQHDGNAYVGTTGAHVNDDNPAVDFRGESWLVSLHMVRDSDGTWDHGTISRPHVTRRQNWSDATPAASKAIVAAVADMLATHATDERMWAGEAFDAHNDAHRLAGHVAEMAGELSKERAALRLALARRDRFCKLLGQLESCD